MGSARQATTAVDTGAWPAPRPGAWAGDLQRADRLYLTILAICLAAAATLAAAAAAVEPVATAAARSGEWMGRRWAHLAAPPAATLPPAPSATPQQPVVWEGSGWLSDAARLRSIATLAEGDAARLAALYRRTLALFPWFVGREPRAPEPFELRLVERARLNDPTFLDLFASPRDRPTVLGVYFPAESVAYATPAAGDDDVVVHELAHHLLDVYALDLEPWDEERRAEGFVDYVRAFGRAVARPHQERGAAAPPPGWTLWHESPAGVRLWAAAPPDLMRLLWVEHVVERAAAALARRAGLATPGRLDLAVRLHDGGACRAWTSQRGRAVDLWLDGCGSRRRPERGVHELGHAVGHLLARAWGLEGGDAEADELEAYVLGDAVAAELRASGRSPAIGWL